MSNSDAIPCDVLTRYQYDPDTGIFRWATPKVTWVPKTSRYVVRLDTIGEIANTHSHGYVLLKFDEGRYFGHRVAWYIMHGEWFGREYDIDHRNGVKHDNRIANLRKVTRSQNKMNSVTYSNNTSGHRGVHWHKVTKRWKATIQKDSNKIVLGYYTDIDDAIAARKSAEKRIYGEYSFEAR